MKITHLGLAQELLVQSATKLIYFVLETKLLASSLTRSFKVVSDRDLFKSADKIACFGHGNALVKARDGEKMCNTI